MEKAKIKRPPAKKSKEKPAPEQPKKPAVVKAKRVEPDDDLEAILSSKIEDLTDLEESELKEHFAAHGYYSHNREYYIYNIGRGGVHYPQKVSNFLMQILFHFNDGSNNTKRLIKIQRHSGEIHLIEVLSSEASGERLESILKSRGCSFMGSGYQLKCIFAHLMDFETEAVYLNDYGYNAEYNFYVMADSIINAKNEVLKVNNLGMLKIDNKLFYLPAFAHSNADSDRYANDRLFVYKPGKLDFVNYAKLMYQAYGLKGITGISFLINCLFRDLIIKETNFFPYLFLYGQAGTGKSHYIDLLLKIFGEKDSGTPIKGSTAKAIARKASQKTNALFYLKEYTNYIDHDLINFFKNAYDGISYSIAEKSMDNSTIDFLIKSGMIIDGNELPTIENAMFDRMIVEHFEKAQFTDENKQAHDKLIDESEKGFGLILKEILSYREVIKKQYRKTFREISEKLRGDKFAEFFQLSNSTGTLSERIINHTSFLLTPISILNHLFDKVLNKEEVSTLMRKMLEDAIEKSNMMKDTNEMTIFWDALDFERRKERPGIIEGEHYEKDLFDHYLFLKLKPVYPFYADYCKRTNVKCLDSKTLSKIIASQPYFIPSNQKGRGAATTHAKLSSCYKFKFEPVNDRAIMIDGKELKF